MLPFYHKVTLLLAQSDPFSRTKCPFYSHKVTLLFSMQVLPNTRHRLCIWHLEQNAICRFGALKKDKEFKYAFNQYLKMCVTEQEFEEKVASIDAKIRLDSTLLVPKSVRVETSHVQTSS